MYFVLVLCVGISANFVSGDKCSLPNGDEGTCKSIEDCDVLNKMTKKNRTPEDNAFLEQTKCVSDDRESEVCCPKSESISCITPDNFEGLCMGLQACPHLMTLDKESEKVNTLKQYVCPGPEENSVCCGPESIFMSPVDIECNRNATSFPPDPGSDCCGVDDSVADKILGGKNAAIDQYPWMAVIEYVKNNQRFLMCGATLISSRYVLTAAHCVKGPILFVGTPKFVRLGDYDVAHRGADCVSTGGGDDCTEGAVLAPIHRIHAHPRFRPYHADRRHDIALMRLKIIVPFTAFIRPICLPKVDYISSPPENFIFTVAGWGTYKQNISANIYYTSDVKQYVDLPYVDRQKCQESVQKLRENPKSLVFEGQICAGGVAGKDSCSADSGGPLMYEQDRVYEIVGIVSFGPQICGLEDYPGVYTYVYDYVTWIKDTIKP